MLYDLGAGGGISGQQVVQRGAELKQALAVELKAVDAPAIVEAPELERMKP